MNRKHLVVSAALLAAAMAAGLAQPPSNQPASPPATPAEKPVEKPAAEPAEGSKVLNHEEREGGVIVEDSVIGTGAQAVPGGAVVAHYRGTLKADGKVFDSSIERGEPILFSLNGVVPGWRVGIPGMKVGGKRRLTIPAAMGYGARGAGDVIPPNADLVFEVELVDVVQDVVVGEGPAFTRGAQPTMKYTIRRVGGTEVFSGGEKPDEAKPAAERSAHASDTVCSSERPEEIDFRMLLPGMQAAMDGMKVGGKRKFLLPQSQAWQQKPSLFPTGTLLECEVELTGVVASAGMPGR